MSRSVRSTLADRLSPRLIRRRAEEFAAEFADAEKENKESHSFWNAFFDVFGLSRRRTAMYEHLVEKLNGGRPGRGRIDVFFPGVLLIEQKSRGESLDAAAVQAAGYFDGLSEADRPRHVLVSDFRTFRLFDLEDSTKSCVFELRQFPGEVKRFSFLTGRSMRNYEELPEANEKAARLMAELYGSLRTTNCDESDLAATLCRLMFCLFADHTDIFPKRIFTDFVRFRTAEDGTDTGRVLADFFDVLDRPADKRQTNIDADLRDMPYVNGRLFDRHGSSTPAFDRDSRGKLLRCCEFDWSNVSPAIFGSMFQMVAGEKRDVTKNLGRYYTSEENILKVLGPALLDGLRSKLDGVTDDLPHGQKKSRLRSLLRQLAGAKVFDPACGCGNFLIVAYRELRRLELDTHRKLRRLGESGEQLDLDVGWAGGLNVDSMYGIELEEFPRRVAETALYLTDHLLNLEAAEEFEEYEPRLPLERAPGIKEGNALLIDWDSVIPAGEVTCVVGNPPYVGKDDWKRDPKQKSGMESVFGEHPGKNKLDLVAAWFQKASDYVRGTDAPFAFVSTNSITQGEQVHVLWERLLAGGLKIRFGHRTFKWANRAHGPAAVHCVIVGCGYGPTGRLRLFEYETPTSEPVERTPARINPYLHDAPDILVKSRSRPLCEGVPRMHTGNTPRPAKFFRVTPEQRAAAIAADGRVEPYIRPYVNAETSINDEEAYCLWLREAPAQDVREIDFVAERVEGVRRFRIDSTRKQTREQAATPTRFSEERQPTAEFFMVPEYGSWRRRHFPVSVMQPDVIASNSCRIVPTSDRYVFGVLQSAMHLAWLSGVSGKMKSDPRYVVNIAYNAFPWPPDPPEKRRRAVVDAAGDVLRARERESAKREGTTLAHLYEPTSVPPDLVKAHQDLDRAVDRCYRTGSFDGADVRVRFLLERYGKLAEPLISASKRKRRRKAA